MKKGRLGGLIFLFVGIYGIAFASQLPMGRWNEPGPGVFPMALAILLSFSGALGISLRDPGEKRESLSLRPLLKPAQIIGVTLAYILVLEWGGFVLTTFLYLFILFAWISRYRPASALGMAAAFSAGGWVLFVKILGLLLPRSFMGI